MTVCVPSCGRLKSWLHTGFPPPGLLRESRPLPKPPPSNQRGGKRQQKYPMVNPSLPASLDRLLIAVQVSHRAREMDLAIAFHSLDFRQRPSHTDNMNDQNLRDHLLPLRWQYVVTAAPESWELAFQDIINVDASARITASLCPGIIVVESALRSVDLAQQLRTSGIFVRHLFLLLDVIVQRYSHERLAKIVDVSIGLRRHLNPAQSFSVQTRTLSQDGPGNFEVNTLVSNAFMALGFRLDVKHPDQAISIVCTDFAVYLGASPIAHNLSDWAGGMRRFARDANQLSRAEFKLLEALEVFPLDLPYQGTVLDLGAAPGGWTRVCRQRGLSVVAVDPAVLDARLTKDRGVTHVPSTAETYLTKTSGSEIFDLIVNDMRIDTTRSARLMCKAAKLLKRDQFALMTLKLPAKHQRRRIRDTLSVLSQSYRVGGVRKLFHNRSEVTAFLQKR